MQRHWYILGISFLAVAIAGCMQPLMVDDLAIRDIAVTHEPDAEAVAVSYDAASLDATVVWHTPTEIDVPSSPAYRYRLNNGDWHRLPDGTSQKRFENLPTGRHVMEVQVRTTQGQWVTIGENHVDISRLRYDGNGHDAGGLPFNSGNSEPIVIASPLDGFSRGSAQFTGWRIGDTIYQPGAEVAFPGTGIFVAYAQWGSGTAADPYQIRSAGDLTAFANHPERWGPGANVALRPNATFDLTNSPGGWTPIGNAATPFQGTFIGGGTTVRGITIDRPTADDQGFFGVVGSGARISDFAIERSTISGQFNTNVLAGRIEDGAFVDENIEINTSTIVGNRNPGSSSITGFKIGPIPNIDVPGNDVYFAIDLVASDGVTSLVSPTPRFTLPADPAESGLSAEFGFNDSWSNSERIVFRGSSEDAMKALNELTITFSDITENFAIRVAAMALDNTIQQNKPFVDCDGEEDTSGTVLADEDNIYFNPSNGHFYEFVNHGSNISWTGACNAAAKRELAGVPGHLVTITSGAENAFIAGNVDAENIWIGAQANDDRVWSWRTGPEAGMEFWQETGAENVIDGNFYAWAPGEPNNAGTGEDSAVTNWNVDLKADPKRLPGRWNDLPNNHSVTRYLVEYSLEYKDKTYEYKSIRQEVRIQINVPD